MAAPAAAQKSADTLRIAWRDAIPNVDPYYNPQRTGLVLAQQVWDYLVYRDPETFQIKPLLALSWKQVDDTTLDFTLRQDVTFHDGSHFGADDVVYTINTVIADKQVSVPANYLYLAGAEKLDDYTVRIHLKRVFPAALEYLAMTLPIWPAAYRQRVGAEEYARHPVGAGPYRITRIDGLHEIDLERFDGYYAGSPKGRPAIKTVTITEVADTDAEMAALLSGQADWIWQFQPDQFDTIAGTPGLQAMRAESMRFAYLSMDAAGRSGAGNPLTNLKVRQAISYAIDRATIAKQLIQIGSRVPDAPCYSTQFGCDASQATRYAYDPVKAKQLLTEAGYPDGFSTDLVTYLVPDYADAIQAALKAVGIDARLMELQIGPEVQRVAAGQAPMNMGSWGSYSINDVSAVLPYFFGGGDNDYARDPEITALVAQGGSTTDPDDRRKYYAQAIARITAQADWLPLFTYVTTYGMARALNFKPYPDELPRFFLTSWK